MKKEQRQFTTIDLFAGAGGLSLAAEDIGITLLAAVEHDRHAQATYKRNFIRKRQSPLMLYADITGIEPNAMMKELDLAQDKLDILMGGPPCQGFSVHRIKNAGIGDPRNKLLLRYFLFVEAMAPKAFIVENVPGLLWPRHKKYLT